MTTSGGTSEFTYDEDGRLDTALDGVTDTELGYSYDEAGRVTGIDYGADDAGRSFEYDELGRLSSDTIASPEDTDTASISYEWDAADQLVGKDTDGVAGAAEHVYDYDRDGRLVSWDDGTDEHSYEWDAAGNLIRDGPDEAVFNERNQLLSHGDTEYTYTPRGTLAERDVDGDTTELEFNAFDELVTDGDTTNTYDAFQRLISTGEDSLTYAGTGQEVTSDGAADYTYTPDGNPLGVEQDDTSALAWTDQHTDLIGLIDPDDEDLAGSRSYSPFGEQQDESGTQPGLGYQHQYTDPDSGDVNMGARWYQPGTGTFASRDTAGLDPRDRSNANRYAYAGGSPLTHTDPSGNYAHCALAAPAGPAGVATCGGVTAGGPVIAAGIGAGVGAIIGWFSGGSDSSTKSSPRIRVDDPHNLRSSPRWGPQRLRHEVGRHLSRSTEEPSSPEPSEPSEPSAPPSSPEPEPSAPPSSPGPVPVEGPISPSPSVGGTAESSEEVAAEAAHQAWLQQRRQRVIDDVNTPHERPELTDTIADSVQQEIEAITHTVIDLGGIDPGEEPLDGTDDGTEPEPGFDDPDLDPGHIDQPGPLPPSESHEETCENETAPSSGGSHKSNV